jgi:hypothetical protein
MSCFQHRHFLSVGLCAVAKTSRMIAELFDVDRRRDVQAPNFVSTVPPRSTVQKRGISVSTGANLARSPSRGDLAEEFDFIIVGNGSAGRSATEVLSRTCPLCSVAVIDPHVEHLKSSETTCGKSLRARATFLDPRARVVRARNSQGEFSLRYRRGVLLATGSRGAPIPSNIVDKDARNRVLELRPTTAPYQSEEFGLLSKEGVKKKVLSCASNGSTIGIVGSGWEALDLAASCLRQRSSESGRVHLYYGDSSPLKNVLPSYLGAALSKRLRSQSVAVHDRTLVRFIALAGHRSNGRAPLELHSVKAYDYLDSSIDQLDWLVVAPEVSGNRGSAVLPSDSFPGHLSCLKSNRSWYLPWSLLTGSSASDPLQLACYKEDGRIAVNQELCACTGVYAAGSVAKFPNAVTGHADPAGCGTDYSADAGRVAAWNMSKRLQAPVTEEGDLTMVKSATRVFRTDTLSCATGQSSALVSLGVEALCVGHCDSERYSTCGIWWTNLASQRRQNRVDEPGESPVQESSRSASCKPVYGVGVVYYVDSLGKVQGVMTWGIPFAAGEGRELSSRLHALMEEIVLGSNGLKSSIGLSARNDVREFLTQRSRQLVSVAIDSLVSDQRDLSNTSVKDTLSRKPLYRCTESPFPDSRISGSLRRNKTHRWASDEALFCRSPRWGGSLDNEPGEDANQDQQAVWKSWLRHEMQFDDNVELARPLREENLWLRKGDESRTVSAKENKISAYNNAIFRS